MKLGRNQAASEQLSVKQMKAKYGTATRAAMIASGRWAPAGGGFLFDANGSGHGLGASATAQGTTDERG